MEEGSFPGDGEAAQLSSTPAIDHKQRGGWITFPFITATMAGLTLASGGWSNNLIVFMIGEFNVKSIDAAQIWSVVNGCISMFPILGAIVADSFSGKFLCHLYFFSLISPGYSPSTPLFHNRLPEASSMRSKRTHLMHHPVETPTLSPIHSNNPRNIRRGRHTLHTRLDGRRSI